MIAMTARRRPLSFLVAVAAYLAQALLATAGHADDWPQWLGPQRDGIYRESGVIESIPIEGLPLRWRVRVGTGYSGPVVAGGRVYVTDRKLNPEVERLLCVDEATGELLWVNSHACDYQNMEYGNGPRASPTVAGGKVYTLGAMGLLTCTDAATGQVVWRHDLAAEFGARIPRYGASAAPLVEDDLLIVMAGPPATVMAFDRATGEERWRALADRAGYAAPIVVEAAGCRQLIAWTADNVAALDPKSGRELWKIPYRARFDPAQATATPVWHNPLLLCLASFNRGSLMLRLDAGQPGASVHWQTEAQPTANISTPIFQDDRHFYAVEGDGSLSCLLAATGERVWSTRAATSQRFGHAHLIPHFDRVFMLNQNGHLILARLSPQGYQELGRTLLIEPTAGYRPGNPVCWAHPAFANQHVIARNDREMLCVSLAADAPRAAIAPDNRPKVTSRILAGTSGPEISLILGLAVAPDGRSLALGTGWGNVKRLNLATGAALPAPKAHDDWVCAVAFSPDGKYLVSAGGSEFTPARNGNTTSAEIKIFSLESEAEVARFSGHGNKVFGVAFSSDGGRLATASADTTVRLFSVPGARELAVMRGHGDAVSAVAFAPRGNLLASGSFDRTIRLWDPATGNERGTLHGHEEEVLGVAFSPDGRLLASGGADRTVRLWNVDSGVQAAVLRGHSGIIYSVAFSPDGSMVASASGDQTIRLWNAATGELLATLVGHSSGVSALAFAPDGSFLASAGLDDAVRLWELAGLRAN